MKKCKMKEIKTLLLTALFSITIFMVGGCADSIEKNKASSQRFFIEKLMVDANDIEKDVKLENKKIVAHNGFGWIDIGGLGAGKAKDLNAYDQSLVRMIIPKGNFEGYAEANYSVGSHKKGISTKYFLTSFPIDYLSNVEDDDKVENSTEVTLNSNVKGSEKKNSLESLKRVCLKKVDVKGQYNDKVAFRVKAKGILVDIFADKALEKQAEKFADLIAAKIEKEVAERYALLSDVTKMRGKQSPSEVGLHGFLGHLEEHLDMGRMEYQPFRKKF